MKDKHNSLKLFHEYNSYIMDKANSGIEQNRKDYFSIKICDKNEVPINNAKVTAVLKNHEFKFGANLKELDRNESEKNNQNYRDNFNRLFNLANISLNWDDAEPKDGDFHYEKTGMDCLPSIGECMEYCEKNNIEPRLQALASEGAFPKWLYGADSNEVKNKLSKRIYEISQRYSQKARSVEAIRGMFGYDDNVGFYNDNEYVTWCLKETEKYMPANQIVINEFSHVWYDGLGINRDRYYMEIEDLLSKNARIDAIGMEFRMFMSAREQFLDSMRVHMYVGWWPDEMETYRKAYDPTHLFKTINKYSDFNRPLHITGVMIPAYTSNPKDEEIQAELLKYLYLIWFSQKNVEQIVYWNIVDGFEGELTEKEDSLYGGLLRRDLSKKPAFYVLDSLINKEWRTEETFLTNEDGVGRFKGFYGEYELTIEIGNKKFTKSVEFNKEREISLCSIFGKEHQQIII